MKTISSISELLHVKVDLAVFILESCPWMSEQWDPASIGYVFVLDEGDEKSICTVPHIEDDDNYKAAMSIDLETFDLWEYRAICDPVTGYWNVVTILGQEYGCTLFMSSAFVAGIPELQQRLQKG